MQFDTIYHEHFTYLSLLAVERVFARHGLRVFDVEEMPTHGGSLRVFVCHEASARPEQPGAAAVRAKELRGTARPAPKAITASRSASIACAATCWHFSILPSAEGRTVAAYGAAAKGNTLLNYCGIGPDRIAFVADRSTAKQGLLLPGSRIPVRAPEAIFAERPDYVLVLPWNLIEELSGQLAGIAAWGGRLVTAIPNLQVR